MSLKILSLMLVLVLVFSACSGEQNTAELGDISIDTTIGDFNADSSKSSRESDSSQFAPKDNDYYEDFIDIQANDNFDFNDEYFLNRDIVDIDSALEYTQLNIPTRINDQILHIQGIYDDTRVLISLDQVQSTRTAFDHLALYNFVTGEYTPLFDYKSDSKTADLLGYNSNYIVYTDNPNHTDSTFVYEIDSGEILGIENYSADDLDYNTIISFDVNTSISLSENLSFTIVSNNGYHYIVSNNPEDKPILYSFSDIYKIIGNESYLIWDSFLKNDMILYSTENDIFISFDKLHQKEDPEHAVYHEFVFHPDKPDEGIITITTHFDIPEGPTYAYYYFKSK